MKIFFKLSCSICDDGRLKCFTCDDKKKLRWFLEVVVKFETKEDDYFKPMDLNDLPDKFIRKCRSKLIYSEEAKRVLPIKNYPNELINQASYNLISSHFKKFSGCRILAQVKI